MLKLQNKTNKVSLWLILFLTTGSLFAQKKEHPYNKYYNWGIVGGINIFSEAKMTTENPDANVSYQVNSTIDGMVGIEYNSFINDKWLINLALKAQWFGDRESEFFGKNETTLPKDFHLISWINPDFTLNLPISALYTYQITPNITFDIGGGLNITYYRYTDIVSSGTEIDFLLLRESNYKSNKNPFYLGAQIEAGIGFKVGKLLLQPKVIYSKSFKSYKTGTYNFYNLQESPDFGGTIDQSGDYIGFSLGIHLRKNK